MSRRQLRSWFGCIGVLILVVSGSQTSWATSMYDVSIDTTGLAGQSGQLAFNFIAGDDVSPNNSVTITSLAVTGSGLLPDASDFTIQDVLFFNDVNRAITFSTSLTFRVTLTTHYVPPGVFDEFAFFVLDANGLVSLIVTEDPTGSDSLFFISIDGTPGGSPTCYDVNTPGGVGCTLTAQVQVVPEPTTVLLLVTGLCAGVLTRRYWRRG